LKSHPRFSLAAAALLAGLAFALGACGGGDDSGGDGGTTTAAGTTGGQSGLQLKIGDSLPLSGDLARYGPPARKAADLALERIRRAIVRAGRGDKVDIEHVDNRTDPDEAVRVARKAADDGSTCITGAWAPRDTIRTAEEVSIPRGILQISPATTSDEVTAIADKGLLNRTVTPDSLQGPALVDAIDQGLGGLRGRVINIGARNDGYGTGLLESFSAALQHRGGRIGQRVVYAPKQPSYDAEAGKLAQGRPDGWVIFDFPDTYSALSRSLVATNLWDARQTWVTDSLASPDLPGQAGVEETEGLRGTAPGTPSRGRAADAFATLFASGSGPDEQRFDAQTFDAVVLCYLSAVAAGSTDGAKMAAKVRAISAPPGRKYTWEQLPQAIRALAAGDDIDYQGASGPIDMNHAGDPTAGFYDLFRFQDRKVALYGEAQVPAPPG
jgi:ABC-type branched-subunit amino acid transport system substrate-binding protein